MKLGYARVSTKYNQDSSLENQIEILEQYGCDKVFAEKISGRKEDRPQLQELLQYARPGDAVVVVKLDRLGRSTKQLILLYEEMKANNIQLISIKDSIDSSNPLGEAMLKMLFVLSEMEVALTRERIKQGIEYARSRGKKGGRKQIDKAKIETALDLYDTKKYTIAEIEKRTNITRGTIYKYLKQREIEKVKLS
jgi:DNA invertase Pin-like site-specific DNA recombinase